MSSFLRIWLANVTYKIVLETKTKVFKNSPILLFRNRVKKYKWNLKTKICRISFSLILADLLLFHGLILRFLMSGVLIVNPTISVANFLFWMRSRHADEISPSGQSVWLSMPKSQQSWVRSQHPIDTLASEGGQMKQCWITYIMKIFWKIQKNPSFNF